MVSAFLRYHVYGTCLQVNDLRMKARLLVQDGVTLMGVMDEFEVLQEGEVYVQVCSTKRLTGMLSEHPVKAIVSRLHYQRV